MRLATSQPMTKESMLRYECTRCPRPFDADTYVIGDQGPTGETERNQGNIRTTIQVQFQDQEERLGYLSV